MIYIDHRIRVKDRLGKAHPQPILLREKEGVPGGPF